jgi:hypothetical protein
MIYKSKYEKENFVKKTGKELGKLVGAVVFFTILYLILRFANKVPSYLQYWHVLVTIVIIFLIIFFINVKK